jgi:SAM-dependent MidA family methyltransferase
VIRPLPDVTLPPPDADARAHSATVVGRVNEAIARSGGWLSFAAYMQIALYEPGLGYYASGTRKFGTGGDFVTSPELTPLFGRSLAVQVDAIGRRSTNDVLELGAGTGRLAADLLAALEEQGARWRYRILEPSPDLRDRQRATIRERAPALATRVEWIDTLPQCIDGIVVMNEVLDALPVHVVVRRAGQWYERGVVGPPALALEDRPLGEGALRRLAQARFPATIDYASELNPAAEALVTSLGQRLGSGALLIVDYGFPRHEYYHAQRTSGTLVAHYRHRVHGDPLLWPGLCDLTAHVDFTAIASAGARGGLDVAGFTTQAAFLLGCGIVEALRATGEPESLDYVRAASAVQTLLSPAEMGELFKVLALSGTEGIAWPGFSVRDMRHRLEAADSV